jgi:hypothetical protein
MNELSIGLVLALILPLFIPLLFASIFVNYRLLVLIRRQREANLPSTIRRGSKKLFIISKDR